MKPPRFFKGLSWLLLLNIVIKPVWIFAIDRQVQNTVGFATYGTYFALLNLSILFSFAADAGLSNMLNRQVAMNGSAAIDITSLIWVKVGLLLLYSSMVLVAAWIAGITHWQLIGQVIMIQALTSLLLFCRSLITAQQLFTVDAWLSVTDKLLMILICGAFLYLPQTFGTIDLTLFLNSQIICTSLAVAIAAGLIFYKIPFEKDVKKGINKKLVRSVVPFALIIVLMSVHYRLDGFLLERLHPHGALQAGIYASAYRLLDAGNMVGFLAASFLVPYIARHRLNSQLLQRTVLLLRHLLLLLGMGVVVFVIVVAGRLEQLLYHTSSAYMIQVLQWCIAALPAYYLVHIYGSVLTAMGQFKTFISILFFCVLINAAINLIYIPQYGALACCGAALVSQYTCGILVGIAASKQNKIAIATKDFIWYLLAAVIGWLVLAWIKQLAV